MKITFENFKWTVELIVNTLGVRVPPCLERQDLYQIGCIALLSAIKTYNPEKNKVKFQTYAFYIIRFRIIDELRRITKVKRFRLKEEEHSLTTGVFLETSYFKKVIVDGEEQELIDVLADDSSNTPFEDAQQSIDVLILKDMVHNCLDDQQGIVLELQSNEELPLHEIGEILKLSESRVSQISKKIKRIGQSILKEESLCQHRY